MATKDELLVQAEGLGIKLTGDETVADIKKLIVEATPEKPEVTPPAVLPPVSNAPIDFSWAVNVVKLNRAKAFVQSTQPNLKGKELESAVKGRYVALGGLVSGASVVRQGKGGRTVNVSEHDGSKDD